MPGSAKQGKQESLQWIINAGPQNISTVLDVGPGGGTYAKLLKINNLTLSHAKWIAVEAFKPYIAQFELAKKYDTIYQEDIRNFDWSKTPNVDLAIFGDILEHMEKTEAQDVINTALDNSKYVLISIPIVKMPQGEVHGNKYEIHVKDDWSHQEVLDSFPHIQKSKALTHLGIYWLSKYD